MSWAPLDVYVFVWEVGTRAAFHAERLPRDLRWFQGLRWTR